MKKSELKQLIKEEISKVLNKVNTPIIELNTSFLQFKNLKIQQD
jgi:hypothetical protein